MIRSILAFALALLVAVPLQARTRDYCAHLSYYWELGDANGVLGSGRVGVEAPVGTTPIIIASASKWLYGAYALQVQPPTATDVRFLTMTSGYTEFGSCRPRQTVASCAAAAGNNTYDPSADGYFFYSGSHHQQHAAAGPAASFNGAALGQAVSAALGVQVTYETPQVAGGATVAPTEYAAFLRRLMRYELVLAQYLGAYAVCTNPLTCSTALSTPIPSTDNWSYSLAHWVEDDGTFSSPGALGFYPWISADRTRYGVLALDRGTGWAAAQCGRQIRNAWSTTARK